MDTARVAAHPFLAGLPAAEVDAIAHAADERVFAAGDVVISERDLGHCLFLVEDGTADVTADGAPLGAVGPGDIIGEIAVLSSGRRTASVIATSPIRAISLFKRDVWRAERNAPELARRFRAAVDEHRATG